MASHQTGLGMPALAGTNPRTGEAAGVETEQTSLAELDALLARAHHDRAFCASSRSMARAEWLQSVAQALEADRSGLVDLADRETALGSARLHGELDRTIVQIGLFIDVLADGSYHSVTIDDAHPGAAPAPRPELRRGMRAVGPVGVWTASNFPFAFGVFGGDTASALAAGCPVVVKAHPSQPGLSARIGAIVSSALARAGAPAGAFSLVHGMSAGAALIIDPRIVAAAFTGSARGGRALFDLACGRSDPIPFFGELGSINPVFVTPTAAAARPHAIAEGLVGSITLGVGQFCTKPGLVFVPVGSDIGPRVAARIGEAAPGAMLNMSMQAAFEGGGLTLQGLDGIRMVESSSPMPVSGFWVRPRVAVTSIENYRVQADTLSEEFFGPMTVLVEYERADDLLELARTMPGCLTATIHGDHDDPVDAVLCGELVGALQDNAGRLIWNGWPTGVAVAWGMQHGGPWPATTATAATSVGAAAIERFLRPVTYQSFPENLIPSFLSDAGLRGAIRRNGAPEIHPRASGEAAPEALW